MYIVQKERQEAILKALEIFDKYNIGAADLTISFYDGDVYKSRFGRIDIIEPEKPVKRGLLSWCMKR